MNIALSAVVVFILLMPPIVFYLSFTYGWNKGLLDMVLVDAMVETKEGTIIYSGCLLDYVCEGEKLDRIYLEYVVKRKLKVVNDEQAAIEEGVPSAIPIQGDVFALPYDNIINLNLRFLTLRETA